MEMGKTEWIHKSTVVFKEAGHVDIAPIGVVDQSNE
jgi:hypothetical protein